MEPKLKRRRYHDAGLDAVLTERAAKALIMEWLSQAEWFAQKAKSDPFHCPALGLFMAALDLSVRAHVSFPARHRRYDRWFEYVTTGRDRL